MSDARRLYVCPCQPYPTDWRFNDDHLDTDADTSTDEEEEEGGRDTQQDDSDNRRVSRESPDNNEKEAPGSANSVNENGTGRHDHRHSDTSKTESPLSRRTQRVALPPRPSTTIRCKSYVISHGAWIVDWLCGDCGQEALDGASGSAGFYAVDDDDGGGDNAAPFADWQHRRVTHIMDPVDLDRPHVWSFGWRRRDWIDGQTDLLSAEHLDDDDFVVPAAATYALDPHILSVLLSRQIAPVPNVRGCEGSLTDIGSVRGWMPLRGACEMGDPRYTQSTRMLMICCDTRHPAWGSVAVVHVDAPYFAMIWYAAETSLERLIERWRAHPMRLENARFAKDWVAWACVFYVDAGTRGEMARVIDGHNEDAVIMENMMDDDHALSDKPWAWLLDRGEHSAFFASEDAVDDALDFDDNAYMSRRHLMRWRKGPRRRRRTHRISAH